MKGMIFAMTVIVLLCCVPFAFCAVVTESEPNNSRLDLGVKTFNIGDTLRGGLPGGYGAEGTFPQDYWQFSATAGTSYTFVGNPKNYTVMAPLDIDLDLENSGGGFVARADFYGDNQVETLNWTCTTSGTYYLVVYEGAGTPNGVAYYDTDTSITSEVGGWELY
jgi:hypothetical protein